MTDIDILRDEADTRDRDFDDEGDAGAGSLARYRASLLREGDRASPTGGNGARRRQPLPREFREGGDEGGGGSASRRGSVNSVSCSPIN
jgi:hypothetical protein